MEAQEKELQQARTHLGLLKDESANAIQSKDLEIREAKDEVTTLKQQPEDRTQEDKVMELANMQNELRVLKSDLHLLNSQQSLSQNYPHHLFEAAPELLHENVFFDAEAKKEEIEKRPSRKQTFGKRLANVREKRKYPREVHRHSPKPHRSYAEMPWLITLTSSRRQTFRNVRLQDLGPGEEPETNVLGEQVGKRSTVFRGVDEYPANAIPCLVDNQLACD
jgi:vacuolar-type H+-ATPase subunit I/STV1